SAFASASRRYRCSQCRDIFMIAGVGTVTHDEIYCVTPRQTLESRIASRAGRAKVRVEYRGAVPQNMHIRRVSGRADTRKLGADIKQTRTWCCPADDRIETVPWI